MGNLKDVHIWRLSRSDQGTESITTGPGGFWCYMIELPWRNNMTDISCIPTGTYIAVPYWSPRRGLVYLLQDVPGRTWVEIHSGNVAGDKSKGYRTHSNGCILPGLRKGTLWGQRAVLDSRECLRRFIERMEEKPFNLHIWEAF